MACGVKSARQSFAIGQAQILGMTHQWTGTNCWRKGADGMYDLKKAVRISTGIPARYCSGEMRESQAIRPRPYCWIDVTCLLNIYTAFAISTNRYWSWDVSIFAPSCERDRLLLLQIILLARSRADVIARPLRLSLEVFVFILDSYRHCIETNHFLIIPR